MSMTAERFEELQETLEEKKEERTKAKTRMETEEKRWKDEFGLKDEKAVSSEILRLNEDITKLEKKEADLETELEELLEEME